ncbi:hypothetical protein BH10PSE19_BH10PSE19_02430 [soil metagenome]
MSFRFLCRVRLAAPLASVEGAASRTLHNQKLIGDQYKKGS